ncbi:hypothetical protein D3C73_1022450 [compost metagenome]
MHVITVFAIIQQADTVAVLGNIYKAMTANLILCLLPARIAMGRPFQCAIRYLIGCLIGNYIYRESNLKQLMRFIPVHSCFEINSSIMVIQNDILLDIGLAQAPTETQNIHDITLKKHRTLHKLRFSSRLLLVSAVNIPCIPKDRTVMEEVESVCRFARLDDFPVHCFIQQADDLSFLVKSDRIILCLPYVTIPLPGSAGWVDLTNSRRNRCFVIPEPDRFVTKGRNARYSNPYMIRFFVSSSCN